MFDRRPPQLRLAPCLALLFALGCVASGDALINHPAPQRDAAELHDFATRYAAAWSSGDPQLLASFYAERGELTVNGGAPSVGRAAIAATARAYMEAFPDMHVALRELESEDGRVRFHWNWTGTNTGPGGTGRAVRLSGHEEWTFSPGGRIAVSRGCFDEAEYARQLAGER
ncbi:MAG: ester cyclase [Planctomycetes bacterium]|nr:ester cyclase [Planctomycetota bacterium]MCB9905909.1 ester cyclase [Planctomycetota bacterium]